MKPSVNLRTLSELHLNDLKPIQGDMRVTVQLGNSRHRHLGEENFILGGVGDTARKKHGQNVKCVCENSMACVLSVKSF